MVSVFPSLCPHLLQMEWVVVVDFPDDYMEEAVSGVVPQKPQHQDMMVSLEVMGQCHPGKRLLLGGLDSLLHSSITLL